MATYNVGKIGSVGFEPDHDPLDCCDSCGSSDVIETREGYSCKKCGIVLEIQKLEYHRPYDRDVVQYASLGKTQMGYKRERLNMKNAIGLESLNKLDSFRTNEESVSIVARVEIKRILTALGFPLTDVDQLLKKFRHNRSQLGKGTKYRSPHMLVPCIIYAYYKENNKPIREKELLEVSSISKKDFNAFKLSILRIWPEYKERNRKEYIVQRILEVTEHFDLGMPFFYQSKKILYRFYDGIKNTKDDVIVGLVTSITLLCSHQSAVSISALCSRLDIKMSTIHRQVEKKVMHRFKVAGFKSLVKSADLLRKAMTKLGVLDPSLIAVKISDTNVELGGAALVVLGSAKPVFNNLNGSKPYYLFMKTINSLPRIIKEKTNDKRIIFYVEEKNPPRKCNKVDNKDKISLELWKYYNPKGPPVIY